MIQKRQIETNNSADCPVKNDSPSTLELPLEKKKKNSRNETILKSVPRQRLRALQNPRVGSKIKIPKNMSKTMLQMFCEKTPWKKHQIFKK